MVIVRCYPEMRLLVNDQRNVLMREYLLKSNILPHYCWMQKTQEIIAKEAYRLSYANPIDFFYFCRAETILRVIFKIEWFT